MGLFERLLGTDREIDPKIPVHNFMAALAEFQRGAITKATVETMFGIRPQDQADFDLVFLKGPALVAGDRFEFSRVLHDILLLGESGLIYTKPIEVRNRITSEPLRPR